MVIPKGYKNTEVGVIPEDWDVKQLIELTTLMTNGFVGVAKIHYTKKDNGVLYIQGFNILENGFNFQGVKYVTKTFHKSNLKSELKENDLLTIQTGDIGVTSIVTKEQEGANCHALIISRFASDYCSKYFSYYFNSLSGRKALKEIETGTTMKHLNVGDLKYLYVPVPKTHEQFKISQILTNLDNLIESLEKLIAKKKLIKEGAMQDLLTGKKRLAGFDEGWIEYSFNDLFSISGGYSATRDDLSREGYCYLHYGDIHGTTSSFIDTDRNYDEIPKLDIRLNLIKSSYLLKDGDIVFVDASEDDEGASKHIVVKNEHDIPFISGLHTIIAHPKTKLLSRDYSGYCFKTQMIKQQFKYYSAGTKVVGISKSNLPKIITIIPPTLEEQNAIASILTDMDTEIDALESKLAKYRRIKAGAMQQLLTGKIRLPAE